MFNMFKKIYFFKFFSLIILLSNFAGLTAIFRTDIDRPEFAGFKAKARAKVYRCLDCLLAKRSLNPCEVSLCLTHRQDISDRFMALLAESNRREMRKRAAPVRFLVGQKEFKGSLECELEASDKVSEAKKARVGAEMFSANGSLPDVSEADLKPVTMEELDKLSTPQTTR